MKETYFYDVIGKSIELGKKSVEIFDWHSYANFEDSKAGKSFQKSKT